MIEEWAPVFGLSVIKNDAETPLHLESGPGGLRLPLGVSLNGGGSCIANWNRVVIWLNHTVSRCASALEVLLGGVSLIETV